MVRVPDISLKYYCNFLSEAKIFSRQFISAQIIDGYGVVRFVAKNGRITALD